MSIRIQVVTEELNPISALIRFSTRSWASHIEFVDTDRGVTVGARFNGGVRERLCASDRYTRVEQFTSRGIELAYQWARTQIGKPYDLSAVFGIGFGGRDWRQDDAWFCSELVAFSFETTDSPLLSTRPSASVYRITPRDILLSREIYFLEGRSS